MGAFGPRAKDIVDSASDTDIDVATVAVIYSHSFELNVGVFFGIAYRATSATGTPKIKIELEQSWTPPAAEGSADGNYKVPEGMAAIVASLADENWHIKSLSPIPFGYGRLKITGLGAPAANPADTIVNAKISAQENY